MLSNHFSLVLIFMFLEDEVEIWGQRVGTLVFRIELNYLPQREAQGSNPTPVLGKSNPQFSLCFGSSQVLPAQWRHWPTLSEASESPPTPWRAGPKLRNREQRARSLRCTRTVAGSAGPQLPACPAGCTESSWRGALALLPSSANTTQKRDLTRILGDQWWYRGGGCSLTTHLALGKKHI